jgi:hypothetical protein
MPWLQGVGGNGDEGGSIICAGVFTVQNAPLYIGGKNPSKTLQNSPLRRLTSNSPISAEPNISNFELTGLLVDSGGLEMANTATKRMSQDCHDDAGLTNSPLSRPCVGVPRL